MRIDHINIRAPQALLEEVRDFYCAVLGLEEGFRPDFSGHGHWLYCADRPLVHLSLDTECTAGGGGGHLDHVAFQAAGLAEFLARLEAHGIRYRSSHVPELQLTQLFFSDPAGTGLEVNFPGEAMP
jgi:catechol 2,3-dioxygenase-like lactoylglutathione lyase family enzyme